jgi:hypothetical protein
MFLLSFYGDLMKVLPNPRSHPCLTLLSKENEYYSNDHLVISQAFRMIILDKLHQRHERQAELFLQKKLSE